MQKYVIKDYQKGFEQDQAIIGIEVARNWIWPYGYDLEDRLEIHAQPDFDPDIRHYCFLGDEMVGHVFSIVRSPGDGVISRTNLKSRCKYSIRTYPSPPRCWPAKPSPRCDIVTGGSHAFQRKNISE